MTGRDMGYLLLCSHLGARDRKPLTCTQMMRLEQMVQKHPRPAGEKVTYEYLRAIGCREDFAGQIMELLSHRSLAEAYISRGELYRIYPIPRSDPRFPPVLRQRLGGECPGVIWARGDLSLMDKRAIGVVGSRKLHDSNALFAHFAGSEIGKQGYVLVSGNAWGADEQAMLSCKKAGGSVIGVVADSLIDKVPEERELYLSLYDYDAAFSAGRALERNHTIHGWGLMTFVIQSSAQRGGTWSGTNYNLKHRLTNVYCFDDGSYAMKLFCEMGAKAITEYDLWNLENLWKPLLQRGELL